MAGSSKHLIVHFVGSIPLLDAETVFRTLASAAAPYLLRLPDGETGIRKTWIRFLQDVLAENPAIERAMEVPPFKFTQWDGKVLREIPRLRVKRGATPDPDRFKTGYAEMALASWSLFDRLGREGVIPEGVKFQVSLPTPIAPTYNNMLPSDRPALLPALTEHLMGEVDKIAAAIPNDRVALQWDVCQEVLAWEGYYEKGPADFHTETLEVLTKIGNAVPAEIELGYHLCYAARPTSISCSQRAWRSWPRWRVQFSSASGVQSSLSICRCPGTAPTTPILRRSKIFVCTPRASSTSASFITTMRKAMRRG